MNNDITMSAAGEVKDNNSVVKGMPSKNHQSHQFSEPKDDAFDFRQILSYIHRHKKMIVAVTMLSILLTYTVNFMLRPTYVSSTVVTIGPNTGAVRYDQLQDVVDSFRNHARFHKTQLRLLTSDAVAVRVIDKLNLDNDPEFTGQMKQRSFANGLSIIKKQINALVHTTSHPTPTIDKPPQPSREAIIQRFLSRLSVQLENGTNLVTIKFTSFSPETAAKAANEVVNAYLKVDEEQNKLLNERVRSVLEEKLLEVQQKLKESERRLTAYAREKGTGAFDIENEANLATKKLTLLNQEFLRAQTERIDLSSKIKNGPDSSENAILSSILEDESINVMEQRKVILLAEKGRLQEIYQPEYPKLKQLLNELDQLDKHLVILSQKHILALATQYKAAQDREGMLIKALEEQSNEVLDLKDRSIEYNLMKREWESNNHLYAGLLERVKQSGVSFDLELSNVTVIEKAKPATQAASPLIAKNTMAAGGLGLMISLGLAGLLGLLDRRLRTPDDLTQLINYPNLAVIPNVSEEQLEEVGLPVELISSSKQSKLLFEETFQSLRTSLSYSLPGGFPQTMMITSSLPAEAKTTTVINLALSIQKTEQKNILLIDLDFRKPRLHKVFSLPQSPGVTDCIVSRLDYKSIIIDSRADANCPGTLSIMPAGTMSHNPIELLESAEFDSLLAKLRNHFDLILVDSPPVMDLADSMVISNKVDAVLVAVCPEVATVDSVTKCFARLEGVNAHVIGSIMTKFDVSKEPYYYHDYSSYHYNYQLAEK